MENILYYPHSKVGQQVWCSKLPSYLQTIMHTQIVRKLVYDKLYFLVKEYISPYQHGFIKGRSTSTNLTLFSNFVLKQLEYGNQCDAVFTDFAKAFDRVNHSILLDKLDHMGLHSNFLKWFRSYLTDRTQFVHINNTNSDVIYATSGVPQGSHLGPLLFLIFVNDIPEFIKESSCLMYADDLKIFRSVKSISDCVKLQEGLSKLQNWCESNSLPLNVAKCQAMSFSRRLTLLTTDTDW